MKKIFFESEESLSELNKYHDHDDVKYIGIRDVRSLFILSNDKDYYKHIKTKSAFNGKYIEYESNGDHDKKLSEIEYLNMIKSIFKTIFKRYNEWP